MHILRTIKGGQAGDFFRRVNFALLPLGSIEYHGGLAHLGTDAILADYFADFLSEHYACARYPAITYTPLPGKTAAYPGGITVRPEVFLMYLQDILSGILGSGVKKILLLNAHDGNMGLSRAAAEAVSGVFAEADILLVNWWQLTDPRWCEQECGLRGGGRGHGGAYEISAAYAALGETFVSSPGERNLSSEQLDAPVPYTRIQGRPENWEGRTGNLDEASAEAGEKILAKAKYNLLQLINQWLGN